MQGVASVSDVAGRLQRTCALNDAATRLRYVNGKRAEALRRLGMIRVRDVLYHLPHRYLDFSNVMPIGFCEVGSEATIVGRVDKVELKQPKPSMKLVEVAVVDNTGLLLATFFRQPWIADQLHPGDTVAMSGKVTFAYGFKQMRPLFYEALGAGESASYARVLPVHPVGEGVSASWMRRIVAAALGDVGDVCDPVPAELVASRGLMSLARALREVHFPTSLDAKEQARRRLAYDELLTLQLALLTRQQVDLAGVVPTSHLTNGPYLERLVAALPFEFSSEQRDALSAILADMASNRVMNRILLGDVGTGKTAVAAAAIAAVADTGTQAAMMAPTSVLARQYAEGVGPLLDAAGIPWALVTGATAASERARIVQALAGGELCCLFGTTALLSDDVEFARLSLVVIDEQHRFGVGQRARLRKKGAGADLLAMTATPIPRTLALSLYGDMEYSRIRHRPVAGAGVSTKVVAPENVDLAYGAIRDAVSAGHQAYVICPLVDDADDGSELDDVPERTHSAAKKLHAATSTLEDLSRSALRGMTLDVLTGRMSPEEKDEVMARFRAGEVDVLVATTVVEVGVDVPNATVMLVFDADRFGLATLHQLRGRVGRGKDAGMVYLCCAAGPRSPARQRLSALERTTDGFELAELDLQLRREGEVLGFRQHGGVTLSVCDLSADADLVDAAHEDARRMAAADPDLSSAEYAALALECRMRYGAYFEEVERA
ncbi:MAG: ATP-dependent DNA helicase RecG [Atopobiaceae bacterium]|nr:ATP-dependent DNA helicase RecG [Atopobiaceae bacterium]